MIGLQAMLDKVDSAAPTQRGTARFTLDTTIGAHSLADDIVARGRWMGLTVTAEKAGGWFAKTCYVTADGDAHTLSRFLHYVEAVLATI